MKQPYKKIKKKKIKKSTKVKISRFDNEQKLFKMTGHLKL